MPSRYKKLVTILEARAADQADTEEEKLKKNLLIFACGLMNFGVMLWLAIYWAMGLKFSTTVSLLYQVASMASLAVYLINKNFPVFRFTQLSLFLFLPFIMQWTIGSYVTSSGVMLWALLAPVGAVFLHGWRESIPWFIAYIAMTVMSGFFDFYLVPESDLGLPLKTIALFFALNFVGISMIIYLQIRYFVRETEKIKGRLDQAHAMLLEEQGKSERLLLNILPGAIAQRLKRDEKSIADGYADTTIMFADLTNFTKLTEDLAPEHMVELLNKVFSNFDFLVDKYGLEKIKTIGDAYMVAGGLSKARPDYVEAVADMALEIRDLVAQHPALKAHNLGVHIGIATGPAVAGVIGTKRFLYDLWGDTVNVASRLSAEAISGRIEVDKTTYNRLRRNYQFQGPYTVTVKGKGELTVYHLIGKAAAVELDMVVA